MKLKSSIIFLILLTIFSFELSSQITSNNKLIKPKYLTPGDTVAIVAPSGVLKNYNNYISKAKELLKDWDLNVVIGENVYNDDGHFAGSDSERILDFQTALDDNSISAIWCARGGYGAMRVIDNLNFEKYKENPKWIIGYSDITAIHSDLHIQKSESIHGLMCKSLEKLDINKDESVKLLKKTLFGNSLSYKIAGNSYNVEGKASGQLVGGNLTLLHCLLGSKSSIDTKGKILFIEDLGEYLYHIDRMLYSLKRAGYFDNLNGLIVGDFTDIKKNETKFGKNLYEIINEIVEDYNFPVMYGFPAGHGQQNLPLIFGRNVQISVSENISEIRFSN